MRRIFYALLIILSFAFPVQAAERYSVDLSENVKKKDAIDFILNDLIVREFSVVTVNDYQIIVKKDATDFATRVLYGSHFNSVPENRVEFTFANVGDGVRIMACAKIITNPNSAYEKSSIREDKSIQNLLDSYKQALEAQNDPKRFDTAQSPEIESSARKIENGFYSSPLGFVYSEIQGSNELLVRGSGENTKAYGLLFFGDRILKFDGNPIKSIDDFTNDMNSIDKFTLTIIRNEKEIDIPLAKN